MKYELPDRPKIKIKVKQPDQRRFCVVPLRAVIADNLTLTGLKVLCLLASYANKAGFTYVSQGKMANDLNVSIPSINKQIKQLETKGFIKQYPGYYAGIKGKTKRIIYDESITDKEASQIANAPIEDFTNYDIKEAYKMKRVKKIKDLEVSNDTNKAKESTLNRNELIASLFMSVVSEKDLLMVEKRLESGEDPQSIIDELKG